MNARWSWRHLLLVSLLAAGCGSDSSHDVSAKSYARTCASVADCFAVYEGPVGCCGSCPNTAIRQDAAAAYMSNFDAAVAATCKGLQPPCAFQRCPDGRVDCIAGVCQLEMPAADAATE